MKINVQIGRIVLDGFSVEPRQRQRLNEIIATELTRRIVSNGLRSDLLAGAAVATVNAGTIQLVDDTNATQLGHGIAIRLYAGIGNREDNPRSPRGSL
jgi:hypothetical protein